MVKNFVIPLSKDELLTSHADQYFVEEVVPPRMLTKALDVIKPAFDKDGVDFILDHFDTFFSIIFHGNKVEIEVCERAFNRIHKVVERFVGDLEKIFDYGNEITDEEDRKKHLCLNNMLAYLFSYFVCYINEYFIQNMSENMSGKRKKNVKSDVEEKWESSRQKALELLYRWLQLPLYKLWKPPIVENSFVTTLAQICYKTLEQSKDAKQKQTRQTIFDILGTLIKKYNHGLTSVVRIIQLVKLYDSLAMPIATGVVHMTAECNCNGLIREVMNEIGHNEVGETDCRNVSTFLENIAILRPDLIIPILDDIQDYLSNDFYTMRNCVIGVMGAVVQKALTGEDLTSEQKEKRDECLNILEEHIWDCNAYVRSKVLQTWQRLCCEGAVPIARHGRLLAATALRLEDKSANVRKQALQLLRTLLQSNPFAGKLNCDELSKTLEQEKAKLQELQIQLASSSGRGHVQRFELWTALESDIKTAIKRILKNDEMENEDEDDIEDEENVDPNHVFEHVRQLLLNRKVNTAVKHLWKTCMKLEKSPEIENLTAVAKEECLFTFLLKIFIESEDESLENGNANGDARYEDANGDANNADKSEQINKTREEISTRKRIINYVKNCLKFATELEKAIPTAKRLLFSTCASDAVESCSFLGIAFQFGVTGAADCMREALFQAFHRDQSVRNNLAVVYKEIYLNTDDNKKSSRQAAVARANNLIDLLKKLQPGQSPALTELVTTWYKNEELNNELLQILWEKFCLKYPGTSPIDSRTALMIITMIGQAESNIITDNLDTLVKIGLGPRAKDDLLLARDTCRALLKIKQNSKDVEKSPLRYPNDHDMFREILTLLMDSFTSMGENTYISFATDAINVIYHLANQPDQLIKKLLLNIIEKDQFMNKEANEESTASCTALSKLLYVIGHVAVKQLVHLDVSTYKELKRRNTVREMQGKSKKRAASRSVSATPNNRSRTANKSTISNATPLRNISTMSVAEDNGEEALEGATDDAEAEFVNGALENEVITGDGLLTIFVPLVLDVCKYPDKYNDENVQAAGALALSKMMTVSSEFCEQSLQLLVTILERSPHPGIRSNTLIGLSDLATRFPNQVEPWSKHIYGRLRDEDVNVRRTCVRMLSNLIMREMIRVKGQVSELALCIIDEDEQIRQETKEFFSHLSQKGNTLYNIMPDILSRLADPELNLKERQFQETIRYILGLMQKERQIDTIIDKICARFKLAATERQWRDLSYCLSLLQFSGKSIRRLIESLPLLKEKIHHKPVLTALQNIIEQTKKKAEAKDACIELEEKIQELLETETENNEVTDQILMPPPTTVPRIRKKVHRNRRKDESDEDEDSSDDSEEEAECSSPVKKKAKHSKEKSTIKKSVRVFRTRLVVKDNDEDDDENGDSDDDKRTDSREVHNNANTPVTPVRAKHSKEKSTTRKNVRTARTRSVAKDNDDSDDDKRTDPREVHNNANTPVTPMRAKHSKEKSTTRKNVRISHTRSIAKDNDENDDGNGDSDDDKRIDSREVHNNANTPVTPVRAKHSKEKSTTRKNVRTARTRSVAKDNDDSDSDDDKRTDPREVHNNANTPVTPVHAKHGKRKESRSTRNTLTTPGNNNSSNTSPVAKRNKVDKSSRTPTTIPRRISARLHK